MDSLQPSWSHLRWMEPQSRWMLRTFVRRNLEVMTDSARRSINWGVLAVDVLAVWVLYKLL